MSACEEYIAHLEKILPEMCRTKDLVKAGIFQTDNGASLARQRGDTPEFFRINARVVLYPKKGVIEFLKSKKEKHNGTKKMFSVSKAI